MGTLCNNGIIPQQYGLLLPLVCESKVGSDDCSMTMHALCHNRYHALTPLRALTPSAAGMGQIVPTQRDDLRIGGALDNLHVVHGMHTGRYVSCHPYLINP